MLSRTIPDGRKFFQEEAAKIRDGLGGRALRVEHVGSTSVPDLPAKPVIYIIVVVANAAAEDDYLPPLENAGYRLCVREPEWYEHRLFKGSEDRANAHVFSVGCPEIDRMLTFRNWLRMNRSDRELYASWKQCLAERKWVYTEDYAHARTEVIEEILSRALQAALPSDDGPKVR